MMAERIILITGRDTEKRRYLITMATERISRDDTIFISIGYEDSVDPLSYKEGIDWLIDSFRYLEAPKNTLIVIDDIVPLIDTTKGYLLPILLELYKEKGVRFIMGTRIVSSEYITPHILSLCSSIISTMLSSEMQSKLIFGTKGAEILLDNEYMMKRKGKMTKGTLSECLMP